jgi:hypothetical protein
MRIGQILLTVTLGISIIVLLEDFAFKAYSKYAQGVRINGLLVIYAFIAILSVILIKLD